MIIILICIALICFGSDWEASERASERRHKEIMDIERRKLQQKKKSKPRKCIRTVAKDKDGRVVAQEIIELDDED